MEERKLPPEMVEVLTTCHFAYLCTTDDENQPHITPTFFVFDQKTSNIYVMTSNKSKKMKNIRINPKICLTIDIRDEINPFNNQGVIVQGLALTHFNLDTLHELDDQNLKQAYISFEKKYPVLKKVHSTVVKEYKKFSDSLIEIVPDRMVYWRGTKFIAIKFKKPK